MTECVCPPLGPGPTVNTVPIAPLSMAGTLERVEMMLKCPATHVINHVPADVTVHARRNPEFRAAVGEADLNVADGMGVVWGCRALGYPEVHERVYGPDFMDLLAEWGIQSGLTHYLLGGTQEVLDRLTQNLREMHPGISIVGRDSPPFLPFSEMDAADIGARINEAHPDIVWIGLGTPKQQLIASLLAPVVDTRVILTVGAAFDFLAGVKPQAPSWMQNHGLEWLFRLASEPRRLAKRYLLGIPFFVFGVLRDIRRDRRS